MKLQMGLHSFAQAIGGVAIVISLATIGRQIESLTDATVPFNDAKFEAYADAQAKAREIADMTYSVFLANGGSKS